MKNYQYLKVLIAIASLLLVGTISSLVWSAMQNPAGKILDSKDYGYQAKTLEDSVFVYTGSTLLFGGSGRLINEKPPIVTEIKYASGAVIMHRKIAISSGTVVLEEPKLYKIYLGSGAIIYDTLEDNGENGLFKNLHKKGSIKILVNGEVVKFGQGEWNYVAGNENQIAIKFAEENKTLIVLVEDLKANNAEEIVIYLASGATLTEVDDFDLTDPTNFTETKKTAGQNNSSNSQPNTATNTSSPTVPSDNATKKPETSTTTPTGQNPTETPSTETPSTETSNNSPANSNTTPVDSSSSAETQNNTPANSSNSTPNTEAITPDNSSSPTPTSTGNTDNQTDNLLWGQYPDTDEGNYNLATDKLNPNYCDRVEDGFLRTTCKETIFEVLGKCDLLADEAKQEICKNNHIKQQAVESERVAKCTEIKNDPDLFNTCINEVNQSLYNSAMEAGDANICKAIYSAEMIKKCKEALGVFE